MMTGFIKYIDYKQECGYITGYDDESYYFEFSSVNFPASLLKQGLEVLFDPNQNGLMLYALDIKLLKDNCPVVFS